MIEVRGTHGDLHSEHGRLPGEHRGRSAAPLVKVQDIAWLEFRKPDLALAEAFAHDFGFSTSLRTPQELHLRGTEPGTPCVIIRKGQRSAFAGHAFRAADGADVLRLAADLGAAARPMPESIGGVGVELEDPSGLKVTVVADTTSLPRLLAQTPHTVNTGREPARVNNTQRPPREPARVQRLGHVVLQTTRYLETLNWYLDTLGMIVSDFLFFPGQRGRGPTMSFVRCDRGDTPADHHTLAITLGPRNRYVHSAYQVADLDALAAGGEYLRERGHRRSWGIGRHIQGSQIFDYWRDPDSFLVEHFSDGDMFDSAVEAGWAPMTASGLAQWGPPVTRDFLGIAPGHESLRELRSLLSAVRADNEFDLARLVGLLKVASS